VRLCTDRGAALLEVMVALVVLGVSGAAAAAMTSQASDAIRQAQAHEAALREASAFLDAVALWSREDLDRRLGDRAQGPWRLRIDRPAETLYVVSLHDGASGQELLRTSLFREGSSSGPR
jgi:type II secretory pathway pseudopilin PulG